jgi:hypothetical protein
MLNLHWRDELIIEVSNSSQTLRKTYRAILVIFITANINKITYPPNVTGSYLNRLSMSLSLPKTNGIRCQCCQPTHGVSTIVTILDPGVDIYGDAETVR